MSLANGAPIAVTGGNGALGGCFVEAALTRGLRLRSLSRRMASKVEGRPGLEHVQFDLDHAIDPDMLRGCAAVVHLAARIPQDQSDPAEAARCLLTNGAGTARLLEAAQLAGVPHFIQTTSANAYAPKEEAIDEEGAMFPAGRAPFYLASKLAQDIFGEHWRRERGLAVTTLRLSSVYGVGQSSGTIASIAKKLIAGQPVRLTRGGAFAADFVTVDDVVSAIFLFLSSGAPGTYNIASGHRVTIRELSERLAALVGASEGSVIVEGDPISDVLPQMDIRRATECGFRPTHLEEGLRAFVNWLREEAQ